MSLQAITDKIKQEAESEAKAILAEAEAKIAKITTEADKQKSEIKAEAEAMFAKQKSHKESVVRSLEKQRASIAEQTVKRRIIDDVYSQAFAEVLALSDSDYVKFMVAKYKKLVPADLEIKTILAPESREAETAEIIKTLEIKAKVELTDKLQGGCVLQGKDFEYDLSLESLFVEERSKSEIKTAEVLFAGI